MCNSSRRASHHFGNLFILQWFLIKKYNFLFQIPFHLRGISNEKIEIMRKQCLIYYENYFASIEKIVQTSIEVNLFRLDYEIEAFLIHRISFF